MRLSGAPLRKNGPSTSGNVACCACCSVCCQNRSSRCCGMAAAPPTRSPSEIHNTNIWRRFGLGGDIGLVYWMPFRESKAEAFVGGSARSGECYAEAKMTNAAIEVRLDDLSGEQVR